MWEALQSLYKGIRNFKRSTYEGFDDPHSVMMRAYPEVPEWAYLIILVISLVLAILCVKLYPAETPVWGFSLPWQSTLCFDSINNCAIKNNVWIWS